MEYQGMVVFRATCPKCFGQNHYNNGRCTFCDFKWEFMGANDPFMKKFARKLKRKRKALLKKIGILTKTMEVK